MLSTDDYPFRGSDGRRKFRWTEKEPDLSFRSTLSKMWATLLDASSVHGLKFFDR
jgi:hypothetical protein